MQRQFRVGTRCLKGWENKNREPDSVKLPKMGIVFATEKIRSTQQ